MSESEETGWRVGGAEEAGQEEEAAMPAEEDDEEHKKEELQQRVQAKAEDLGGEEASLIKDTEEGEKVPITETKYEPPSKKVRKKTRKLSKSKDASKKDINLISMSRQLEKQSKQLAGIEKVIQSLQNSFNKIDRQSNTIKQLYGIVTQLQRQMHRLTTTTTHSKEERKEWYCYTKEVRNDSNETHSLSITFIMTFLFQSISYLLCYLVLVVAAFPFAQITPI